MEILDLENMTPNQNHSQLKNIPSPLKRSSVRTRLSPLKDKKNFFESSLLSPTRSSPLQESNNVDGITVPIIEYKKLERSLADSIIKNKDLIREQEKIEDELSEKDKQIEYKSRKINELVQENSSIMTELRNERELNEQEFNSWSDLKSQLEFKIYNLNHFLKSHEENHSNSTKNLDLIKEDQLYTDIQNYKTEINKLKKKLIVLQKENELEVQSKMMIIEELEILKEKWDELGTKHELLKQDYEELVQEFTSLKIDETENGDDEVTTPTEDELISSPNFSIDGKDEFCSSAIDSPSLRVKKKRIISSTSSATTSSSNDKDRNSSYRNSSLTKIIRDIELKSQKQKHSQEMMKYNFEIKSLQLQNEKLHSYIGFLLQQMEDFDKNSNIRITSYGSVNSTSTATENQMSGSDLNNDNSSSNMHVNTNNDDNNDNDNDDVINNNNRQGCNIKIPKTTISPINHFEYSDEINIRSAKKNLKTIIKSASAFPIRPLNFEKELKCLDPNFLKTDVRKRSSRQRLKNSISNSEINYHHRSKKHENKKSSNNNPQKIQNTNNSTNTNSINTNINNKEGEISDEISFNGSVCNSIDYSTDYNQGEVEYLDLGDSDFSFDEDVEGDGDVEDGGLEEDNDEPVVGVRRTLDHNSRTSTDSLNVSFKMDLVPQLNLKRSKLFKRAPRKQLQKLTTFPSQMNIKVDTNDMGNDSEILLDMKSSNKSLKNHSSDLQLNNINIIDNFNDITNTSNGIFSYPETIDQKFAIGELEDEPKKLYLNNCFDYEDYDNSEIRLNNDKYKKFSIFNHISEEEEEEDDDDYRIGMSTSEDDEDEEDDEDDFNISTQEIDMFKIVVLRKFYCPRHSMFQCFCRSMNLVDPGSLYLAFSPIIGLKRRLRLQKQREREREKEKIKHSNSHPHSRNHPMRYHKHEKEILPHVLDDIKRVVVEEENETEQTSSCDCNGNSDTISNNSISYNNCATTDVEGDNKLVDENDIYIVD